MDHFVQSIERLVDSHSQSFDKGERLNKQLRLLQVYIKSVFTEPEKYSVIDTKNTHFAEFRSTEFEEVLERIGFVKDEDLFRHSGNFYEVPLEFAMQQLEDHRHLSFADIVEIVQAGKTPPGIKQINEQPIGTDCVKSSSERPAKPWGS